MALAAGVSLFHGVGVDVAGSSRGSRVGPLTLRVGAIEVQPPASGAYMPS
jgi:hypothetical protein